jgi:hypothetical protein
MRDKVPRPDEGLVKGSPGPKGTSGAHQVAEAKRTEKDVSHPLADSAQPPESPGFHFAKVSSSAVCHRSVCMRLTQDLWAVHIM